MKGVQKLATFENCKRLLEYGLLYGICNPLRPVMKNMNLIEHPYGYGGLMF